jgi:hypothetical protein
LKSGHHSTGGAISTGVDGISIDESAEFTNDIANSGAIPAHGDGIFVELVTSFWAKRKPALLFDTPAGDKMHRAKAIIED